MTLLNGLAYILPKILKLEKIIKYYNNIEENEVINIIVFKDEIVIRTYKSMDQIEKHLIIKK